MKVRLLFPLLAVALLLGACGDDGGEGEITADPADLTATSVAEPTGTTVGPTRRRRLRRSRRPLRPPGPPMFDPEGTPSDDLVDEVRARLVGVRRHRRSTAGCGEEYLTGVCEGLDALTQEGLLVILPLTTAQCL